MQEKSEHEERKIYGQTYYNDKKKDIKRKAKTLAEEQ